MLIISPDTRFYYEFPTHLYTMIALIIAILLFSILVLILLFGFIQNEY